MKSRLLAQFESQQSQRHIVREEDVPTTDNGRGNNLKKLQEKRQRRGECPRCGIKLFKFGGVLGKKKTPLSIEGHVDNGRCLGCYPYARKEPETLNTYSEQFNADTGVPQFLSLQLGVIEDDGGTVISGITLDHHLHYVDDEGSKGDGFDVDQVGSPTAIRRCETDNVWAEITPGPPTRTVTSSCELGTSRVSNTVYADVLPPVEESKREFCASTEDRSFKKRPPNEQVVVESVTEAPSSSKQTEQREIFFDSARWSDQEKGEKEDHRSETSPQEDIVIMPESLPTQSSQAEPTEVSISSLKRMQRLGNIEEEGTTQTSRAVGYDEERFSSLLASISSSHTPECSTMESIISQLWNGGKRAKQCFMQNRGYEFLTQIMWSHMFHEPLEERAVELFLSTVASEDEDGMENDNFETTVMMATEEARNAMEALLFVMQSLSHNEAIQITACRALVCLAAASGLTEGQIDDGSSSGAAAVVLMSMAAHKSSISAIKWCLRALYELCTISSHAESNKRTVLAASTLDESGASLNVVLDCLQDPVTEAVRLVWCLSASENARGPLDPSGSVLRTIVQMLRSNIKSSSGVLIEALLGATNNLYVMADESAVPSAPNDLVHLAFQAALEHRDNIGLCTEAMALIANIAATCPINKNMFVGGIGLIAELVMDHEDAAQLHEESACALLSLALDCESVKAAIRSQLVFGAVKRLCRLYESSTRLQEILCTLISSVVVTSDDQAEGCEKDAIGLVCFAMTLHSNSDAERVQEACCVALRNLSSRENSVREHLISSDAIDLVIEAMSRHFESKMIVTNVCDTLSNVRFSGPEFPTQSKTVISMLLKAMRTHIDDVDLILSCLRVLVQTLQGSETNKKQFCHENGIEVATSVMLLHRETDSLLVESCGILATLSFVPELVPAVVKAGGISYTVDAIRAQSPSIELLLSASQFLTNAVLAMPDQCNEVGGIVAALIESMKVSPNEVEFQSEACRLLWASSCLSEAIRSRILDLGGVAVLLGTLENHKESDVQNNALEAFNELANPTGQVVE